MESSKEEDGGDLSFEVYFYTVFDVELLLSDSKWFLICYLSDFYNFEEEEDDNNYFGLVVAEFSILFNYSRFYFMSSLLASLNL